jgi:hypothetical protein
MPDDESIPALLEAIRKKHGCDATWIESQYVHETFQGQTAWEGDVQVFELIGHPKGTAKAYAWSFVNEDTGKRLSTVVLGEGPVTTPLRAVQVYLVSKAKSDAMK